MYFGDHVRRFTLDGEVARPNESWQARFVT